MRTIEEADRFDNPTYLQLEQLAPSGRTTSRLHHRGDWALTSRPGVDLFSEAVLDSPRKPSGAPVPHCRAFHRASAA